ncbi:hypothetical protein EFR42_04145 [Lactobacillus delbrueckii]|nr:hypothetical protein [Lactobacillus delbrueckii]MCT3491802.1 hypothetical protein [Lactobacillus delbrueckii]
MTCPRRTKNGLLTATFTAVTVHGSTPRGSGWLTTGTKIRQCRRGESIDSPFFFTLFSSFLLFQKVIPFYLFYKSNLLLYNI